MGIRLKDLKVVFRDRAGTQVPILDIPEFAVPKGTKICLTGGSGEGKTTLLNVLAGITMPVAGNVIHGDTDITTLSEPRRDRFRAKHIGYVFQTFNLLQGLTALENVLAAAHFAGRHGREVRARGEALIERMGLSHRFDAKPGTLSVGEQQRVAIARAVVNSPRIVLADEPTANLDEVNGDEVLELLKEVTSDQGSILLIVTHEPRVRAHFEQVVPLSEIAR